MMAEYRIKDVACDDLPRGVLIGTVELWDCTGGDGEYEWHVRKPERAKKLLKPTGRATASVVQSVLRRKHPVEVSQ